jgi:hypothetical protein
MKHRWLTKRWYKQAWRKLCRKIALHYFYRSGRDIHQLLVHEHSHRFLLRDRIKSLRFTIAALHRQYKTHARLHRRIVAAFDGEYVKAANAQTIKIVLPRQLHDEILSALDDIPPPPKVKNLGKGL